MQIPQTYSTNEVASIFKVDTSTVHRWGQAGRFGAYRPFKGSPWRFLKSEVDCVLPQEATSNV